MFLLLFFVTGVQANFVTFLNTDTCAPHEMITESNAAEPNADGQCIDNRFQSYSTLKTSVSSPIGPRWTPEMTYFEQYDFSDSSCTQEIRHLRVRTEHPSVYFFVSGKYICTENSVQFRANDNQIGYEMEINKCIAKDGKYTKTICTSSLSVKSSGNRLLSYVWIGASFLAVNY